MSLERIAHAAGTTAVGLIAGTALAHVFEMPHKLAMTGDVWLLTQSVLYNGWGGKLLYLDLIAVVGLAVTAIFSRKSRTTAIAAVAIMLAADVVVFAIWIRPTNNALDIWKMSMPMRDWRTLRLHWEWGHAMRCALLILATLLAAFSAPRARATGVDS